MPEVSILGRRRGGSFEFCQHRMLARAGDPDRLGACRRLDGPRPIAFDPRMPPTAPASRSLPSPQLGQDQVGGTSEQRAASPSRTETRRRREWPRSS